MSVILRAKRACAHVLGVLSQVRRPPVLDLSRGWSFARMGSPRVSPSSGDRSSEERVSFQVQGLQIFTRASPSSDAPLPFSDRYPGALPDRPLIESGTFFQMPDHDELAGSPLLVPRVGPFFLHDTALYPFTMCPYMRIFFCSCKARPFLLGVTPLGRIDGRPPPSALTFQLKSSI